MCMSVCRKKYFLWLTKRIEPNLRDAHGCLNLSCFPALNLLAKVYGLKLSLSLIQFM